MDKYKEYMLINFPQTLEGQWLQCKLFSTTMRKVFPELRLKFGCVTSEQNLDNYCSPINGFKIKKQYIHYWLETIDGEIIDPTALQFSNLGKLDYEEWKEKPVGKCWGCGRFVFAPKYDFCGECGYSTKLS